MAHLEKYKAGQVSGLMLHYLREAYSDEELLRFDEMLALYEAGDSAVRRRPEAEGTDPRRKSRIDPHKTHENYVIGCDRGKAADVLKARIAEVEQSHRETRGRAVKSDAVRMADLVATLPEEYVLERDTRGRATRIDEDKAKLFFDETLAWARERYGAENVPFGAVHRDETTPHIHIPIVPEFEGGLAFNSKFKRAEYKKMHGSLADHIHAQPGLESASVILDESDRLRKMLSAVPQDKMDEFRATLEEEQQGIMDDWLAERQLALDEQQTALVNQIQEEADHVAELQAQAADAELTMLEAASVMAEATEAKAKSEQERLDAHQLKEDALEAQARAIQDQNERQPLWRAVEFIAIKCEETGFGAVAKFLRANVQPIVSKWEAEWQVFNDRMDARNAERNARAKLELRSLSGRPSRTNDWQFGD